LFTNEMVDDKNKEKKKKNKLIVLLKLTRQTCSLRLQGYLYNDRCSCFLVMLHLYVVTSATKKAQNSQAVAGGDVNNY